MAQFERVDLAHGWFEPFDDNELHLHSLNADPPKFRLSVDEHNTDEGNLGGLSLNTRRDVGESVGELDEWVFAGGRLIHDRTRGAFVIAVAEQQPNGQPGEVREVALFAPHAIVFNVPVEGLQVQNMAVTFLRAPGGETELHCQGDGNAVMYDVRPFSTIEGQRQPVFMPGVPLATLKDGKIRDFREDGQYA